MTRNQFLVFIAFGLALWAVVDPVSFELAMRIVISRLGAAAVLLWNELVKHFGPLVAVLVQGIIFFFVFAYGCKFLWRGVSGGGGAKKK